MYQQICKKFAYLPNNFSIRFYGILFKFLNFTIAHYLPDILTYVFVTLYPIKLKKLHCFH
jgi:mannitol-specific phosphotransferase system IIBC component